MYEVYFGETDRCTGTDTNRHRLLEIILLRQAFERTTDNARCGIIDFKSEKLPSQVTIFNMVDDIMVEGLFRFAQS